MKLQMGKERRGDCYTIFATGGSRRLDQKCWRTATITDNPMSSAHQIERRQESDCGIAGVLTLHHGGILRGAELNRHCRVHENPQSTARCKTKRSLQNACATS